MCRIWIVVWVLLVVALAGLPAGVQAEGGDDGLVAEWHFDEGSGSVAADSSGNGNDGVIHGATWVEGKYGKALSFDGVDDYVDCGNDASLDDIAVKTLVFWVNLNAQTGSGVGSHFLNKGCSNGGFISTEPSKNRNIFGQGFSITYGRWSFPQFSLNKWHQIVVVYDRQSVTNDPVIYVDGVSQTVTEYSTPSGTANSDAGNNLLISADPSFDRWVDGSIDEIHIYNRALTADEIKSHYEGQQTALALSKSAAPHSIKQGQTSTITLTVTNTGTTEITDIEVADTIPLDLTFVSGETSKTCPSLRPKDSREFQYVLQPSDAGTFNLDPATATYADEEGNYHTAESETAAITVIPSTDQPTTLQTAPKSSAEISTASVHLHGEKTDVVLGEDVLLKLSAVNIIGNPLMRVQVIIIPPSGWSVTSSEFAKSGAGQYTTTYDIKEGVGRDIEVRIMPNQIGDDFQVQGRIIYYFGDDSDAREDHTLTLPITVRAEAENGQGAERTADTSGSEEKGSSTPGFAAVVAAAGVLLVALLIKRRRLR